MNVFRRAVLVLFPAMLLAVLDPGRVTGAPPLGEADLVKLIELRIDDVVIVSRIEKGGVGFPVDAAAIERLTKAGASDAVVAAVQKTAEAKKSAAPGKAVTYQDVLKLLELGIDEKEILKRLEKSPTLFILDANQVDELKKAGASEQLLAAMRGKGGKTPPATDVTDIALILDCSGSMNDKTKEGSSKMEVAQKVVPELIAKIPNGRRLTFLIYGHNVEEECNAIKVVRPLSELDDAGKAELTQAIAGLHAVGHTPIAGALQLAGKELAKSNALCGLILITDGMETCHGDPNAEAAKLAANPRFTFGLHVIGFDVDPKEQKAVEDIARAGKGTYYDARDAAKLNEALGKLEEKIVAGTPAPADRPVKPLQLAGKDAKPGAFFNDAPVIVPGEYKGSLPFMGADYYQVPLHKGQELRVIGVVQKTPYQASNSVINQTFSITIYDGNLAVVAREQAKVEGNPKGPNNFRATWTATADDMAYVAIAASDNHNGKGAPIPLYKDLNPKPSPYTLRIKVDGEAAEGAALQPVPRPETKPGAGFPQAGELTVPGLAGTDLMLGEVAFYRFPVKKGETFQASAAFAKPWYNAGNGNIKATYTLTVYDDDQVQIAQKKAILALNPPDAHPLTVTATVPLSGNAYVSVSCENTGAGIYPEDFKPKPGRLAVQVTKGKAEADSH